MFFKIISIILILSVTGYGLPLEHPSENMAKFFSPRIIGGTEAPEGYAPHMAALLAGTSFIHLTCGASILRDTILLTAAHCIDMYVIWGQLSRSFHGVVGTNTWNRGGHMVYFEDFHIHPGWNWDTIKNDIGFLKTNQSMPFSEAVQPIKQDFKFIGGDVDVYVAAWGRTENWDRSRSIPYYLQLLYLKTISHEECLYRVTAAAAAGGGGITVNRTIEICTLHSVGHGMCNGDSGSALVLKEKRTQIGIVSWGFPCAHGVPDVFARISGFSYFVNEFLSRHDSNRE